jgi:hypothetical protein
VAGDGLSNSHQWVNLRAGVRTLVADSHQVAALYKEDLDSGRGRIGVASYSAASPLSPSPATG